MKDKIINEDILKMAVKISRIIDDGAERDNALSHIAQIQTAVNCPDDALETIAQIRYDDIRADAMRKSLDNMLSRYSINNDNMPLQNLWLDKLMDDTMAIPEPEIRCPKLHAINLIILSRLGDKEKALSLLKMTRREFLQLDNVRKRSKYLFAVYQMFEQLNDKTEAAATLRHILKRVSEYKPFIEQGAMIGMVAHEFWKMQDKQAALECIYHAKNKKALGYAYLQLIKLLAVGGNINDALPIVQMLDSEKQKNMGMHFIGMGKSVIENISKMPGVIISINKSQFFRKKSKNHSSDYSSSSKPESISRPVWFSVTVAITSEKDFDAEDDADSSAPQSEENSRDANAADNSNTQENWDKYDWDGYNWDSIKDNHKELADLWSNNEEDDSEEDDLEEIDSEYDDLEEDDAAEDDPEEDKINKFLELIKSQGVSGGLSGLSKKDFEVLHNIIQRKLSSKKHPVKSAEKRMLSDRYFCIIETIPGTVSFNRTLPPSLFLHFLCKLTQFFNVLNKDNDARITPRKLEKIEDYIIREKETGFDNALQEIIIQGDYSFAVECALNHFCILNKDKLIFGYESL